MEVVAHYPLALGTGHGLEDYLETGSGMRVDLFRRTCGNHHIQRPRYMEWLAVAALTRMELAKSLVATERLTLRDFGCGERNRTSSGP